jgi:hypothetical protein
MTISLITDGMLNYYDYPIVSGPGDIEGAYGPAPHRPCEPEGIVEPRPPGVPIGMEATGTEVPHVPCGVEGSDPTIEPPRVPRGAEGGKIPNGSPSTPRGSRGDAT